ncbi:MAG: TetR/AcrR family transcriptional regulator [Aeromicrobium sp.]
MNDVGPESAPPPRRRNARGDGQRLRADILAAAEAILDETGNEHAVTLRAVARRVGIAAPSIYPHFDDPQAILLAIVEGAYAALRDRLVEARDAAGPDPADRLEAICSTYLDLAAAQPERYRVMFGGVWNARNAIESEAMSEGAAVDLGQDVLKVLVDELAAAARAGRSATDDPYADAVAIWLAMHGLAQQRAVSRYFPFPDDIVDRLVRPLLRLT